MKKTLFLLSLVLLVNLAYSQADLLQSGPMVGYSSMREALLWVQTNAPAEVHFEYYEVDKPKVIFKTNKVSTQKQSAYVAQIIADEVLPGKKYEYKLYINKKLVDRPYPLTFQSQTLWQYRTDPPPIKFALGSCTYINETEYDRPGNPYGGNYNIFTSIHEQKPEFMLWLGDNTYLREVDWDSKTGIFHRYTHTRSTEEIQALLGSTHHYAIWDDHDYGPNDSDASYPLKETTLEAFKLFWGNPNYGAAGEGGITGSFQWADIQFFLLDNRYFRTANRNYTEDREMLGKKQIDWLINALVASRAPFKFVCIGGQVLNSNNWYETYATFEEERAYLLKKIRDARVEGVIFLDGDRHHTVLSKMQENERAYPLYDLTCSSLTAGAHAPENEPNVYMVPQTMVGENNFAIMEVKGPRKDRVLTISIRNVEGDEIWNREIKAKELEY